MADDANVCKSYTNTLAPLLRNVKMSMCIWIGCIHSIGEPKNVTFECVSLPQKYAISFKRHIARTHKMTFISKWVILMVIAAAWSTDPPKQHQTYEPHNPTNHHEGDEQDEFGMSFDPHRDPHSTRNRPNVIQLPKKMIEVLMAYRFSAARFLLTDTIEDSIERIHAIALDVLKEVVHESLVLLVDTDPGFTCVKILHISAAQTINYLATDMNIKLHEYKQIKWSRRYNVVNMVTKIVQNEICELEYKVNQFTRNVCYDIYRSAHIGLSLRRTHPTHPRYEYYRARCVDQTFEYMKDRIFEEMSRDDQRALIRWATSRRPGSKAYKYVQKSVKSVVPMWTYFQRPPKYT